MINYTLDYEFAKEGNFTINLFVNKLLSINFVNKNKQISKEGPATNGNVQSFHGYLRPTPIDGVLALKWQ